MNPILAALQTAEIAVNEIGLKRDGIIAILMQTSVIDGYQTIEEIQKKYGDSVAHIISGLRHRWLSDHRRDTEEIRR